MPSSNSEEAFQRLPEESQLLLQTLHEKMIEVNNETRKEVQELLKKVEEFRNEFHETQNKIMTFLEQLSQVWFFI